MTISSKKLFRKDLDLEGKWWHRLAKAIFVVVSFFILFISILIIYELEESNARDYQVIESFSSYISEAENNCAAAKAKLSQGEKVDINDKLSCYLQIVPSFLRQNTLQGYSLGCSVENGKVEYLSEFSFKEDVSCGSGPEYNCTIPGNICDGDASRIVKYDLQVKYGFLNYISIALKTLAVFVCWLVFGWLLYYKGLLYIIYGSKKQTTV